MRWRLERGVCPGGRLQLGGIGLGNGMEDQDIHGEVVVESRPPSRRSSACPQLHGLRRLTCIVGGMALVEDNSSSRGGSIGIGNGEAVVGESMNRTFDGGGGMPGKEAYSKYSSGRRMVAATSVHHSILPPFVDTTTTIISPVVASFSGPFPTRPPPSPLTPPTPPPPPPPPVQIPNFPRSQSPTASTSSSSSELAYQFLSSSLLLSPAICFILSLHTAGY